MAPILIFGGTGGIGSAIARRLVARGDSVRLLAQDAGRLQALGGELNAPTQVVDVTDPDSIAAAFSEAGPVGGLVYAVGTITVKPLASLSIADFERDFRVNALGAAIVLQAAAPALKAAGGASVVLFSTVAVAQGFNGHASISMAKGAVEGLARAVAAELAPDVRVNVIAPSLTRTPLAETLTRSEPLAKAVAEMHALRRLGEPEDIAGLATFLLSADAAWMTGQVIGVDGGRATLRTKG